MERKCSSKFGDGRLCPRLEGRVVASNKGGDCCLCRVGGATFVRSEIFGHLGFFLLFRNYFCSYGVWKRFGLDRDKICRQMDDLMVLGIVMPWQLTTVTHKFTLASTQAHDNPTFGAAVSIPQLQFGPRASRPVCAVHKISGNPSLLTVFPFCKTTVGGCVPKQVSGLLVLPEMQQPIDWPKIVPVWGDRAVHSANGGNLAGKHLEKSAKSKITKCVHRNRFGSETRTWFCARTPLYGFKDCAPYAGSGVIPVLGT